MKLTNLIFCVFVMPLMVSCMNGEYEQISLNSWEEAQTFKLNPPKKVEKLTSASDKNQILLKIEGEFTAEDRIYAYHDESCNDSISSVHAVHRDHVVLNVPSHLEHKGEIYLVNSRGDHSTRCTKLRID